MEEEHASPSFSPVAAASTVALGDQLPNILDVGGDMTVKGCFIDDAPLNFDKPRH
jgi:hypothetical protein